MYPKNSSQALNKSIDFKKQAKREQLANLLINKFRNKYDINPVTEKKLDDQICEQIKELVLLQDNLSEK